MNSVTSIARSGLNAALLQMDTAAHNIANLQTSGFRRQQVVQQTQHDGGVTAHIDNSPVAGNGMAADLVQQQVSLYAFKANLRTIRAHDEMLGSLLDVKA
jgi:flagellar hook-associated protein FlgK